MTLYDPAAARKRLLTITREPDVLAAFDAMTACDEAGDSEAFDVPVRHSKCSESMDQLIH